MLCHPGVREEWRLTSGKLREKKACTTITNSPAVIVPNDPGAAQVVRLVRNSCGYSVPNVHRPGTLERVQSAAATSDSFTDGSPQCSVNGTAIDPDLNDVATLEAQFYACETNDILHTATGTNLSPHRPRVGSCRSSRPISVPESEH